MGTNASLPGCNPKKMIVESRERRMSVAERQRAIERLERSRTRQRRSEENSAAEGFAGETRQEHTPERSNFKMKKKKKKFESKFFFLREVHKSPANLL